MLILQVLTEPKNALAKQYKKLFDMNNVRSFPLLLSLKYTFLLLWELLCVSVCGVKTQAVIDISGSSQPTKFGYLKKTNYSNFNLVNWREID